MCIKDCCVGMGKVLVGIELQFIGKLASSQKVTNQGQDCIKQGTIQIKECQYTEAQKNHLYSRCPNPDCTLNQSVFIRWSMEQFGISPPKKCISKHISGKAPAVGLAEFINKHFEIIYQTPGFSIDEIKTIIIGEAHFDEEHQMLILKFIKEYAVTGSTLLLEAVPSMVPVDRNTTLQAHLGNNFSIKTLGWDIGTKAEICKMANPDITEEEINRMMEIEAEITKSSRALMEKLIDIEENGDKYSDEELEKLIQEANQLREKGSKKFQEITIDPEQKIKLLHVMNNIITKESLKARAKTEVATFNALDAQGCPLKIAINGLLHCLPSEATEELYDYAKSNPTIIIRPKQASSALANLAIANAPALLAQINA